MRRVVTAVLSGCSVALCLFAPTASGAVPPDGRALATSPTHSVSVGDVQNGCANGTSDGGSQILLSDDRDATWTPGPCDPKIMRGPALDPMTMLLVYSTKSTVVWISEAGNVLTEVPAPPSSAIIAADHNFAYVSTPGGTVRVARDGTTYACGNAWPGDPIGQSLIALADGTLVGWDGPPRAAWAISRDDCVSYAPPPNPVACGEQPLRALGPETISCATDAFGTVYDVAAGQLRLGPALSSGPWGIDGATFEELDALSTQTAPRTWPAGASYVPQAVPGDPFPTASVATAVNLIDREWRAPLGLPPITWSALAARVAADHANEWALAGILPAPFQDDESPGAPGFTGEHAATRCSAAGLFRCSERPVPGEPDPAKAIEEELADPVFDMSLVTLGQIGVGSSAAGSVIVTPPDDSAAWVVHGALSPGRQFDLAAPVNTPGSALRVWPPDGATQIAATWTAPSWFPSNVLANSYGGPFPVGFPIFAVGFAPATFQLLDPHGRPVHLIEWGEEFPATTVTTNGYLTAFPTLALTPGATYTIDITPVFGAHQDLRFTVAGGSSATPTAAACRVTTRQSRAGHMTRLTLVRSTSTCGGVRVQWRWRARGAWRTMSSRGIVAPHGRVLYWRAVRGTRVVLHGRIALRRT